MASNERAFLDRVPDLSGLELAILLSLVADQHCLITTPDEHIDDLASELALISSEIFNLSYTVVSPEDCTSIEAFTEAILNPEPDVEFGNNDSGSAEDDGVSIRRGTRMQHSRLASVNIRAGRASTVSADDQISPYKRNSNAALERRVVANVLIAKDFPLAPLATQIAVLELITRRRIYSRTTVHPVPKVFLFIAIVSETTKLAGGKLNQHLNDHIMISHFHGADDGFANLEELEAGGYLDGVSINNDDYSRSRSRSRRSDFSANPSKAVAVAPSLAPAMQTSNSRKTRTIARSVVDQLRRMGDAVNMTSEIRRYLQDIVVFMRMERGVAGGITPAATTHFVNLAKYLAPLHGIEFVTPSLVGLAARKVYAHRIQIVAPERERSMLYGSDLRAVKEVLDGLTPEIVIENVLDTVPCPV